MVLASRVVADEGATPSPSPTSTRDAHSITIPAGPTRLVEHYGSFPLLRQLAATLSHLRLGLSKDRSSQRNAPHPCLPQAALEKCPGTRGTPPPEAPLHHQSCMHTAKPLAGRRFSGVVKCHLTAAYAGRTWWKAIQQGFG